MSVKKHLKRLRTEFVTCARCQCEYTFTHSDYNFYKTKDAILKANGWSEFADKPKRYLLCHDCTFSRKYHRLVFTINNVLQTIISHHSLKEVSDDHNVALCELCVAIQRATFVTNDFKNSLRSNQSFFYTEKPPKKSSFDDSYDFLSDSEIVILQKFPSLLLGAGSLCKPYKAQTQVAATDQLTSALLKRETLPKLSNSFVPINTAPKTLLDESDKKGTETFDNDHNILTLKSLVSLVLNDEEQIQSHHSDEDENWSIIDSWDNSQDITTPPFANSSLDREMQSHSTPIDKDPNSLLNEISDNAHDQPINGRQLLLDNHKSKHKFCLPKRATANNPSSKVNNSIWSKLVQTLSLPLMLLSSIVLGMFLLLLSFVLIHMFSQS